MHYPGFWWGMVDWQVFGLMGVSMKYRFLLATTSRRNAQLRLGSVFIVAFVPTYRCGAAPDLHRIPSKAVLTAR